VRPEPSTHLSDDQLLEAYLQTSGHAHIEACAACRTRYDRVASGLDELRETAMREADSVFTVARLHEQRDRIMRRLDRNGHIAAVLRFPNRFAADRGGRRVFGHAQRWIAGAAVAGLVAGLVLGFAVDRRVGSAQIAALGTMASPAGWHGTGAPADAAAGAVNASKDEQVLSDIEDALTGPTRRVRELRTIDALTIPDDVDVQEASFIPQ
jgi:hypothetical protein